MSHYIWESLLQQGSAGCHWLDTAADDREARAAQRSLAACMKCSRTWQLALSQGLGYSANARYAFNGVRTGQAAHLAHLHQKL